MVVTGKDEVKISEFLGNYSVKIGGMTWWKEFLIVACFTLSSSQEEIRVYPRQANLENSFACIQKMSSQVSSSTLLYARRCDDDFLIGSSY